MLIDFLLIKLLEVLRTSSNFFFIVHKNKTKDISINTKVKCLLVTL